MSRRNNGIKKSNNFNKSGSAGGPVLTQLSPRKRGEPARMPDPIRLKFILRRAGAAAGYWMKSPHFWIAESAAPHGMIGTDEVEFFGEPSMILSE